MGLIGTQRYDKGCQAREDAIDRDARAIRLTRQGECRIGGCEGDGAQIFINAGNDTQGNVFW